MALPDLGDALARWEPRLLANGIDPNDMRRAREAARDWPGWFEAMVKAGEEYEALGKEALAEGRRLTAGELLVRAALHYHFAQFALFDFPELQKEGHLRKMRAFLLACPLLQPPVERFAVPYRECRMPVHLRRPSAAGPHPWVLLVPGLDSTKEEFHTFEALFLARGMAVASFDGPGQGETAQSGHPWRPGDEAAAVAVVDTLRATPDLDPDRGALLGVSFGGYLSPAAASLAGTRVRACAGIGGPHSMGGEDWERLPLLIQEDFRNFCGAATMAEAQAVGRQVEVAPRIASLQVPALIIHGSRDSIFPPDHAYRTAGAGGGRVRLSVLEGGNHVCNNRPWHYRPLAADWLLQQVLL